MSARENRSNRRETPIGKQVSHTKSPETRSEPKLLTVVVTAGALTVTLSRNNPDVTVDGKYPT